MACETFDDGRPAAREDKSVTTLLRRMAVHRTGQTDLDVAFGRQELERIRNILVSADQARGRPVRLGRSNAVWQPRATR